MVKTNVIPIKAAEVRPTQRSTDTRMKRNDIRAPIVVSAVKRMGQPALPIAEIAASFGEPVCSRCRL